VITIGRAAAALAFVLAAGVHPVAAQEVSPEACSDIKEQIRYLVNEGAFIQDAGLKEGVDLLANSILACLLVTTAEVGAAMRQGVVANESDPAGVTGAQGCEFNGAADAYTDVMYFQADASTVYDMFHATAEANGVQAVPGLGDRAFSYVGGNGPGVVVAKGEKVFTLEFSGIGSGPTERSSLLVLAQQAVGRVH
jgi:hypothetical protein